MRKFIIQHWFGIFRFKNRYSIAKSILPNFLLLILSSFFYIFSDNETLSSAIVILAFAIVYFNTDFYFRQYPIKWEELPSDLQKWYYGCYWVNFVGKQLPWPQDFKDNLDNWRKLNKVYQKN
jgi:amino acid transporter